MFNCEEEIVIFIDEKLQRNVRKMKPHDHGIVVNENEDTTICRLRRSWSEKDCLITDFLEYLYGHRG